MSDRMTDREIIADQFLQWAMVGSDFEKLSCNEQADAILAALSAQGRGIQGWQPIETAPKDGNYIIFSGAGWRGMWVGYWRGEQEPGMTNERWLQLGRGWSRANQQDMGLFPTHWMPLPAPPVTPEKNPVNPSIDASLSIAKRD